MPPLLFTVLGLNSDSPCLECARYVKPEAPVVGAPPEQAASPTVTAEPTPKPGPEPKVTITEAPDDPAKATVPSENGTSASSSAGVTAVAAVATTTAIKKEGTKEAANAEVKVEAEATEATPPAGGVADPAAPQVFVEKDAPPDARRRASMKRAEEREAELMWERKTGAGSLTLDRGFSLDTPDASQPAGGATPAGGGASDTTAATSAVDKPADEPFRERVMTVEEASTILLS
jgi:hypothetical protein